MAIIWLYLLPIVVFWLIFIGGLTLFSKDKKLRQAIIRAGDILLTENEVRRKKDGQLVNFVVEILPKVEHILDLEKVFGYNLKKMLLIMGDEKKPERVYADHLITAFLTSSIILVLPVITGFSGYILLFPIVFFGIMIGQGRMVTKKYRQWQSEVIKDIPELIDKMRISLASGKDYISAFRKVQENSGPRLSKILANLINDMQIMRPTAALDEFARSFDMPVMIKFAAAVKIGIEVGYEQAESYFRYIEEDIRELRKAALVELTRNKPQKIFILHIVMVAHVLAALGLTAYSVFSSISKII